MIFDMKKLFFAAVMAFVMSACSKPYVIIQVADAQLGFTASDRCIAEGREFDGDVSYEVGYLKKAVTMINDIRPDAVVFTGDQVHHAASSTEWSAFKRAVAKIDKDVKVFYLPGNHDIIVWGGEKGYKMIGGESLDMGPFEMKFPKSSFCHEEKDIALVGINSNLVKYDDTREGDQFAWLHEVLERNKDKVTLVFGHHPFFLKDIDEEDGYFQIQKSKRKIYFDLFSKYGVDVVYTGHLHDNSEGEYQGIPSKTTTSVSVQLGDAQPSVRVITIDDGVVTDELVTL